MTIAIRNYQGEVPIGIWYCIGCKFECSDLDEAAEHSDKYLQWLYFIPSDKDDLRFEIHPSDGDGVYLNIYSHNIVYNDVIEMRINCKDRHLFQYLI